MLNEEKNKISESYNEQSIVFNVLARHIENLYLVNLEKKTASILKLNASYVDVPSKESHQEFLFEDVVKNWINTIVHKDDRNRLLNTLTIKNANKVFKTKDELVGNYRTLGSGEVHHFQYCLSKASSDGKLAILGFQNIDDIIKEHEDNERDKKEKETIHQKEIFEQISIIKALSLSFRNVFVANMKEGTARAIRLADDYKVKVIRDVNNTTFDFDKVVDKWISQNVYPEDKEKVKSTLNVENLRKVFSKQDMYVGRYRSLEDGIVHYYQFDCRRINDTDNVVVGFQLIDKIVEEQKEAQKREMALKEARIAEEKEKIEVINSLSTIYSSILQANIETEEYEILTTVSNMDKLIKKNGIFNQVKETLINTYIDEKYKNELNEFLDFKTLSYRLDKVNTIAHDYKSTTDTWVQARFIVKRRDENKKATEVLYVARDITEEKLIKYQAEHDSLTGLLNRGSFDQIFNSIENEKRNFALFLIDVDKFKTINDMYGHAMGDTILKKVANILAKSFNSIDYVCRTGGDEFAVIMMDVTNENRNFIDKKMKQINALLEGEKELLHDITLSVGIAFSDPSRVGAKLYNNADSALYYVKQHGRNGYHFYSEND